MLGEEEIITSYTYYSNGLLRTKTEPKENVTAPDGSYTTTCEYDSYGNLTRVIDSLGNETVSSYDDIGNLKTMTTPEGNTFTYDYDKLNRVTMVTDPQGNTTESEYDGVGNIVTLTIRDVLSPENPVITAYEYDEADRLKKTTDALGNTTEYEYDLVGNLITTVVTDNTDSVNPVTHTTTCEYDKLDRLDKIHQWLSETECYTTAYEYDKAGNKIKTIDGQTNSATYEYDGLDRLWKVTDAVGNAVTYTYDKVDNLLTKTDPMGNITTRAYDDLYRLESITDALNNVIRYEYDKNSNVKKLVDANNHSTQYTYDELNRLTATTYQDGTIKSAEYEYDSINKIYSIKRTDQKNQAIIYDYDYQRNLIKKTYPDTSEVSYTYDGKGRLTDVTDLNGTIDYGYDILGRVTQVTYPDTNTVGYEYNGLGSRAKLIYPDSSFITYEYDKLNRLKLIKGQENQALADYTYDPQINLRTQKNLLNNTSATYTYNELYQMTNISNLNPALQVISGFTYGYDETGNRKYVIREHNSGVGDVYTYDDIYRVTNVKYNVTDPVSESQIPGSSAFESEKTYNLDPAGNRLSVINGGTAVYIPNDMNQYETAGDTAYTYDENGNMTEKITPEGTIYYTYDYENRLTQVVNPQSQIISYKYDVYNHRIQKDIDGVITKYIYDGGNVIAEYGSGNNLIARYVHGSRVDELIQVTGYQPQAASYYYHYDGLGSVTDITDSSGNLVESYSYDIYGEVTIRDTQGAILDTSSISNPYFFTGRRFDTETGLYYYRARYYDPNLGRFLTTDPIGYLGGINLYAYCHNDPVNFTDPSGYCEEAPKDPKDMTDEELDDEWKKLNDKKKSKEGLTPGEEDRRKEIKKERLKMRKMAKIPGMNKIPNSNDLWWEFNFRKAKKIADELLEKYPGHNDINDAKRHAEWSKRMAEEINQLTAYLAGILHELDNMLNNDQSFDELLMDLNNNRAGREAAQEGSAIDPTDLTTIIPPSNKGPY